MGHGRNATLRYWCKRLMRLSLKNHVPEYEFKVSLWIHDIFHLLKNLFLALPIEKGPGTKTYPAAGSTCHTKIMVLKHHCLLKRTRALWKMAGSNIELENVQDEPGLWYQKAKKESMTTAVCQKCLDANLRGSHWPKVGPFEHQ